MKRYCMIAIENIKEIAHEETVYDLHVENDHSYTVGENIAVHNSVCATRKNTGVGVPQLQAIRSINKELPHIPIISDGGIQHYGDIPKALKYANAVMVGSLIAGTSETPGHVYQNDQGEYYKVYGGSASGERKVENGGDNSFVEGVVKIVPFKGKVKYILRKAQHSIQSSMSYSGAENMEIFRKKSILADISSGARQESKI